MLPAMLMGWKGASLAWKIGSIAVPIALMIGLYHLGHWRGYHEGEQRTEERHAKQALDQAKQVVEHTAKQAEIPPAVLQEFMKDREDSRTRREILEQRNREYERERAVLRAQLADAQRREAPHEDPTPALCPSPDPLDESFVARWDDIGRLFLEADDARDRPESAADRDTEGAVGLPAAPLQTDTLLRARTNEFDEYRKLLDTYNALREFSKGVYIFQKTWHQSQQQEPPR